jgi:hypothetical protein
VPLVVAAVVAIVVSLTVASGGAIAGGAPDTTSTAVVCTPGNPATGSGTACTATVTDTVASPQTPTMPTGTVEFSSDHAGQFTGLPCTLATVTTGVASCQVTFTPAVGGNHSIRGHYDGDSTHDSSDGYFSLGAVDATTTVVTCGGTSVLLGDSTDCQATVTDSTGNAPMSGTVKFGTIPSTSGTFGTAGLCEFTPTATSATSVCPIRFTPPSVGIWTVTVQYSPDDKNGDLVDIYHSGSSGSTSVTANGSPPTTTTTTTGTGGTPPPGNVNIASRKVVASKGHAPVKVSCAGAAGASCAGTLTLSVHARIAVPAHPGTLTGKGSGKHKPKPVKRVVLVILGSATYALGSFKRSTLQIKLSKVGEALLAAARHHKLKVTATAGQVQQTAVTRTLTLTIKTHKRKKHKHHHK